MAATAVIGRENAHIDSKTLKNYHRCQTRVLSIHSLKKRFQLLCRRRNQWGQWVKVENCHLIVRRIDCFQCSGFDLPRQQWSLLNRFRTEQGHCGANRRKWQLIDTDLCPCGETQMMFHIDESCPLTKLNGGLSRLHSADEDAVSCGWPVMVHDTHMRRRRLWHGRIPSLPNVQ